MLIGLPSMGTDSKSHNSRTASYGNCLNWQKNQTFIETTLGGLRGLYPTSVTGQLKVKHNSTRTWFSTQARYSYPLWKGREKNLRCSSAKQKAFPCKHLHLFAAFTAVRSPVVVRLSPVRSLLGGGKPLLDQYEVTFLKKELLGLQAMYQALSCNRLLVNANS